MAVSIIENTPLELSLSVSVQSAFLLNLSCVLALRQNSYSKKYVRNFSELKRLIKKAEPSSNFVLED